MAAHNFRQSGVSDTLWYFGYNVDHIVQNVKEINKDYPP